MTQESKAMTQESKALKSVEAFEWGDRINKGHAPIYWH